MSVEWFEIPVANMERAVTFYSAVFGKEMHIIEADETRTLALMPPGAGKDESIEPRGSLLHSPPFEPSKSGTIVYLKPGDDLDAVLKRVEEAGGQVSFPKFPIGHGHLANFIDSEGNTVGLLESAAD